MTEVNLMIEAHPEIALSDSNSKALIKYVSVLYNLPVRIETANSDLLLVACKFDHYSEKVLLVIRFKRLEYSDLSFFVLVSRYNQDHRVSLFLTNDVLLKSIL